MFQEETVFILGAGSNLDYGFVTGAGLKARIKACLNGDVDTHGQLTGSEFFLNVARSGIAFAANDALELSRTIRRGIDGKDSIDDYLHAHEKDEPLKALGKFAIVHCILEMEKHSQLAVDPGILSRKEVELPWGTYDLLWRVLTKGVTRDGLDRLADRKFTPVTLITFNYDRSLEQFLFCKFVATYRLSIHEALQLVRSFNIFHAYGSVGKWVYSHCGYGDDGIPYGAKVMSDSNLPLFGEYKTSPTDDATPLLKKLSTSVSTYMEEANPHTVAHIKAAMHDADQIYFLGMGYHEQNMRLLLPRSLTAHTIAGTGKGLSDARCRRVSRALADMCSPDDDMFSPDEPVDFIKAGRDCAQLFADFGPVMEDYSI